MNKNWNQISNSKDKSLGVLLMYGFGFIVAMLFGISSVLLVLNFDNVSFSNVLLLPLGSSLMILALILTKQRIYYLAKYLLVLTPSYIILIFSILSKSQGFTDSLFLYLTPRFFTILFLMAPIIFFGLRHLRHTILSFCLLLVPAIFFDSIHSFFGVGLESLEIDLSYYNLFILAAFSFYMIPLLSLLFFQKVGLIFRKKSKSNEQKLIEDKDSIIELNDRLEYQAYLYKVLSYISEDKPLNQILQNVLELIIKSDTLTTDKKGVIFLKNGDDNLEMVANHNAKSLKKTCALITPGQCLCGIVLKTKSTLFCDNVDHQHTITPEGMVDHGHYVMPIKEENDLLGVLNIYCQEGSKKDEKVLKYLEAVTNILAKKISSVKAKELLLAKKEKIESQKIELDSALNELNSSIQYASHLQNALIPNKDLLKEYFKDGSVMFLPKEKIGGDFYFAKKLDELLYFGVGDCTGHGIPGAILASMSIEAIKLVIEDNIGATPDIILEKLRVIACNRFSTSNEGFTYDDSMDAAICMFDFKTNLLSYSGGFMNLYVLDSSSNIQEFKATKSPVGKYRAQVDFKLEQVQLNHGDTIYITTDGYLDQFGIQDGSEKFKKFNRRRFLDTIQRIHHLSSDEQTKLLSETLQDWKAGSEQIDDITVMVLKHEDLKNRTVL